MIPELGHFALILGLVLACLLALLPAWVGVPEMVTLLTVVPVIDRPAGRLATW